MCVCGSGGNYHSLGDVMVFVEVTGTRAHTHLTLSHLPGLGLGGWLQAA